MLAGVALGTRRAPVRVLDVTRYAPMLFFLAAVWGASYLFIKVAVEDIEPAPMMAVRRSARPLPLLAYLVWRLGCDDARSRTCVRPGGTALVLGVINAALPFWLIAWGEKHIDSSVAAVLQATVPIFVLLLGSCFLPHERLSGARVVGLAIGIVGVARRWPGSTRSAAGGRSPAPSPSCSPRSRTRARASTGSSRVSGTAGPVLAAGSMLVGGLDPAAVRPPPAPRPARRAGRRSRPSRALTLLGTAVAQLVLFRMLRLYGSARLSLVTYLMPGFALVYGVLLLDEPITAGVAAAWR